MNHAEEIASTTNNTRENTKMTHQEEIDNAMTEMKSKAYRLTSAEQSRVDGSCAGAESIRRAEAREAMIRDAAPELLEACKRALNIIHNLPWDSSSSYVSKAQDACVDAIAKAEGGK